MAENKKEGKMAKYDAKEIADDAMDVFKMIDAQDDLPEWLEAKITKSADYMNSVKDYLTHHMKDNNMKETKRIMLKNLISEKKELGGAMIDKIYNLTDRNAHNMARETLAKAMGNKKLLKAYEALNTLHTFFYDMNDLMDARRRLDKDLFKQAKRMYSDYEQIHSAF